jgi:catechol-2,3-dioxygenase
MGTMLSRVGYLEMLVPDVRASVRHAVDILGLREVESYGGRVYLTCSDRHHELVLGEASTPMLGCVGLEVADEESFDALEGRLEAYEIESCVGPEVGVARSRRVRLPGGIEFDLFIGMDRGQAYPYDSIAVRPRKFGHATLKSSQPEELDRLLREVFGFRLSDSVPGVLSWYRCNQDHHGVAIVPAEADGLHHYAFELEGWSHVEAFSDHLGDHGIELIWGPGRHGPGRNIFTYHLDPVGAIAEVFTDLELIETELDYVPGVWEATPKTLNHWGPPPPDDFLDYLIPARKEALTA